MPINPVLFQVARERIYREKTGAVKQAIVPPGTGMDPAAAGGAPPPQDPAAMGGAPPPGGAPPGGMPAPTAPAGPVTGQPLPGMMPPQPMMDPAMGGAKKPKFDPAMLDQRLYSVQMQLSAIMNKMDITMPPEAMVMPPAGAPPVDPSQAVPGAGSPADAVGPDGGGGQDPAAAQSAIPPVEPMQAAMPDAGGGGAPKMAEASNYDSRSRPYGVQRSVAALAALYRSAAARREPAGAC